MEVIFALHFLLVAEKKMSLCQISVSVVLFFVVHTIVFSGSGKQEG